MYQGCTNSLYNPSQIVGTGGTTLVLADTTQSTDSLTGALIVSGGAGIAKDVNIGGALDTSGAVNINDTTQSSSNVTGALIVDGGVGIAKQLNVGGNVDIDGTLTVGGTAITGGGGVGSIGWGGNFVNNSGGSVGSGSTTTGDKLLYFRLDVSGNIANGGAIGSSGETYQNISGISIPGTNTGYFQRTA